MLFMIPQFAKLEGFQYKSNFRLIEINCDLIVSFPT